MMARAGGSGIIDWLRGKMLRACSYQQFIR